MDWVKDYYTRQSETFGKPIITDRNRQIAELLHGWCRGLARCDRVLELGAGAGGLAAAMADLGHDVWAVEFNPSDASFARELAGAQRAGTVRVVEQSFYEVELGGRFDFVYYWDGFGVGTDADQRRLLMRIGTEWLSPDGFAMIDVFSPWNWQRRAGETSVHEDRAGRAWQRRVDFDALGNRLLDHWSPQGSPEDRRTQSIRCYSIPEFEMLLEGTGTKLDAIYRVDGAELDCTPGAPGSSEYLLNSNGYFARVVNATQPEP